MTTNVFEIIEDYGCIKVRVPYGKLKLFGGSLDVEQAEALAQGILAAVAQIRTPPPPTDAERRYEDEGWKQIW